MEHIRAMENIIFVENFWKLIINFHFTFRKFEDRLSTISRCKLFLEILRIFFILWLVWDLIAESKASKTVILISQISLLIQNLTFPNSLNRRFFRARDLGIKTRANSLETLGVQFWGWSLKFRVTNPRLSMTEAPPFVPQKRFQYLCDKLVEERSTYEKSTR